MSNDLVAYYKKYNISPVKQNIDNLELHYERRRKLYRQCGIPVHAFYDADVLEVGPGGGYNTLAFFKWMSSGGGHVELVEPNPQGIKEMESLFACHHISSEKYTIHSCLVEDLSVEKKFDIVIAEGFLPMMNNQVEIINKLKSLTKPFGIIVITCIDDVCMFIEMVKRLMGLILVRDIDSYHEKKDVLVQFFEPQLTSLRGMSRSVGDWVEDQILNPSITNGNELSIGEAISLFCDDFYVLGTSPRMFTDYSWYKDIWSDTQEEYKRQFREKRLTLLMAGMPETIFPINIADQLADVFGKMRHLVAAYEKTLNDSLLKEMYGLLEEIEPYLEGFEDSFVAVVHEVQEVVCDVMKGVIRIEKYPHLFAAFGKTQQYIAFEKK